VRLTRRDGLGVLGLGVCGYYLSSEGLAELDKSVGLTAA
jgi:hypothetical protein